MSEAHDLLVELVAVLKTIPAEHTDDFTDLGSRIQAYLRQSEGGGITPLDTTGKDSLQ